MGRRLDKIFDEVLEEGEEREPQTPPAGEEPPKNEEPPQDTPPAKEPPADDEPPKDTPPAEEPPPAGEPPKGEEPPKKEKDIPEDPMKRAEFSFKRQLSKQKEKHEKELAARDEKLAALEKKLAELEKRQTVAEPKKTRDDFDNDEDYIDYLTDLRVRAALATRDEELAKKEAERLEAEQKKAKEQEELLERQEEWYGHVQESFGGDKARSDKFLERVAYANKHGLGQILDSCPVASDYLLNDPMGPVVFEKLLNDRASFEQVFNPRRTSQMAIYYELRKVEASITEAAAQPPAGGNPPPQNPAGRPNVVPPMGRPGKQAGGGALTNTDMFDDPKALRKWLREHRG